MSARAPVCNDAGSDTFVACNAGFCRRADQFIVAGILFLGLDFRGKKCAVRKDEQGKT